MKPNDKAIEAAILEADANIANRNQHEWFCKILTAAYAAQFQSEDYADVIKSLRVMHNFIIIDAKEQFRDGKETMPNKAADAIEALLAERDALKAENDQHKSVYQKYVEATDRMNGTPCEQVRHQYEVAELRAELALAVSERDDLAARLAPVEDEALVEMVVGLQGESERAWRELPEEWKKDWRRDARAAIAAIRPHIEAAERERIADTVKNWGDEPHFQLLAAAIRRGE